MQMHSSLVSGLGSPVIKAAGGLSGTSTTSAAVNTQYGSRAITPPNAPPVVKCVTHRGVGIEDIVRSQHDRVVVGGKCQEKQAGTNTCSHRISLVFDAQTQPAPRIFQEVLACH